MEMVLFIGIQGSGKSTFYLQRFYHTHVRINGDMLKTGHREKLLIDACLAGKQPYVVDRMNATREARANYVNGAKGAGFSVVGYYFETDAKAAIERNHRREGKARVPVPAIYASAKRLQPPSKDEGFDALYIVRIGSDNQFVVEPIN